MEKAKPLSILCVICLLCLQAAAQRKNVLLIFGDDAGLQLGAYNSTDILMPNFDTLAARSVVFNNGFTSVSSCSPSRSVLLTGLPQHENGMYGLAQGIHHFRSFDNITSLPLILSANGIRTGIIGKKHVTPDAVYRFDYEATEEQYNIDQIGRNITLMKQVMQAFLAGVQNRPFFLYMAFHDPHRCDRKNLGEFCEKFGNGQPGFGTIPDWKPVYYNPNNITIPYYLPDTPATRQDLANMYTTYSRMDQGVGLFLKELNDSGHLDNTLVMYTSDNGIPFPNAKTNLYEPGMAEPMMISSPQHREHWGTHTDALASTMDFVPTILDWFNIPYPATQTKLTGKSLLPLTLNPNNLTAYDHVFASHNFHEVTMYYPMRVIRTPQYRLIHNLNYHAPFGMATDIFGSPTFQDILNRTDAGERTNWFKSLPQYYFRDQYELYDLFEDIKELDNLAYDPAHDLVFQTLKQELMAWQQATKDPWQCLPTGVLMGNTCELADNLEPSLSKKTT